ncbi:MAG: FliI/YscN family ATPase [Rhodocyclales bacterium]|nr:FliI/YscN family ATPase [Rhodocyclales bacterium]
MQLAENKAFDRWSNYLGAMRDRDFCVSTGRVTKVSSLVIESLGPKVFVGELCKITGHGKHASSCMAEVVGLRDRSVLLMPFGETRGIGLDGDVVGTGASVSIGIGPGLLGRVIDPFGRPLDSHPIADVDGEVALRGEHRNPLSRRKITSVFETGMRAVDTFLPIGKGQRVGIFAGSGVGKSTLLGMIARDSRCDVNVIALIGERGREVGEFLAQTLGESGLARSVVVVATSDQPALVRELAAHTATAVAEYFCGCGKDVLLIMDSVTRFAMAHREIGLSVGEPATARGYTPSAFAALPRLLERAGSFEGCGSITGIYTVLVEGDDLHEPVSDHMRAILDGHIVLSRDLANQGHYPAIDLLKSVSRLASDLWSKQERETIRAALRLLSARERHRDMIEIGAYRHGSNSEVDEAVSVYPDIERFLMQDPDEVEPRQAAFAKLQSLMANRRAKP